MSKVKIIGIGNPLRGDDGVGIAAVERLSALALPEGVAVLDGGTGGMTLLALMEGAEKVIFIDGVEVGRPPGSIVRLSGDDLLARARCGAAGLGHAAGLAEVLALGRELEILPEVVLFGVQVAALELHQGLSPAVEAALERLVARVAGAVAKPASREGDI